MKLRINIRIHAKKFISFQEHQNITFTRTKAGPNTDLYPIFHGGGYDLVPTVFYRLFVE